MSNPKDTLAAVLQSQGFGSRKDCRALVRAGGVEIGREGGTDSPWRVETDPDAEPVREGLALRTQEWTLPYRERLFLAFHKPAGVECSHTPTHHQSVFSFFPEPFLRRGLQAVGRLDADTTGLLLLSDSGAFNHLLTSPKKQVSKIYRVEARHPIAPEQVAKLAQGVELRGEDGATLPAEIRLLGEKTCELTILEGKYHQVKRMFAAVSNRVEKIHRVAIGDLHLEDGLAPGQWRYLDDVEVRSLGFRGEEA